MSQKYRIALVLASLLACSSLSQVVLAQVVDPCQYGCPKSGCPQCKEGGPTNSKADGKKDVADHWIPEDGRARAVSYDQDKCISSCDMQYDSCIKRGNTNPYCGGLLDTCHKGCLRGPRK